MNSNGYSVMKLDCRGNLLHRPMRGLSFRSRRRFPSLIEFLLLSQKLHRRFSDFAFLSPEEMIGAFDNDELLGIKELT